MAVFSNKLSLNVPKTISMLLDTKKILHDKSNGDPLKRDFRISEELIELNMCDKYLVNPIDNHMKWKIKQR